MTKISMNRKVDWYFNKAEKWHDEFEKLRTIVLDCQLTEELKWGNPCYTFQNSNIVLIHGFKEYCALLFFKGALLKDANGILYFTRDKLLHFDQQKIEILKLTDFSIQDYIFD